MSKLNLKAYFLVILRFTSLLIISIWSLDVNSEGILGYTGSIQDSDYAESSGSGGFASAEVELKYGLNEFIILGLTDDNGNLAGEDLLGESPGSSKFSVEDSMEISEDILAISDVASSDFQIRGKIFSSKKRLDQIRLSTNLSHSEKIILTNLDTQDQIKVTLKGLVICDSEPIGMEFSLSKKPIVSEAYFSDPGKEGIACIELIGDIDESSLTSEDAAGLYTGTIAITVSNL